MVRRRRLAAELRRLREAARLTCEEVAARPERRRASAPPRDASRAN
jgi:hypothetical protein